MVDPQLTATLVATAQRDEPRPDMLQILRSMIAEHHLQPAQPCTLPTSQLPDR